MATSKLPKRYAPTDLDDTNIGAGAGIASSKLADGSNFIKKDGSVSFTGGVDFGNQQASNVPTPSGAGAIANKAYVDNAIAALNSIFDGKGSVRAASTANVTISNPGTASFDGVTLSNGDRLLLKNQTAQAENGIYIFNGSGVALTRATDFDAWAEIPGGVVTVEEGTANADTIWLSTANAGGTLGTTAITWFQVPTSTSGLTSSNFVDQETPSGSVNGSNVTFGLANTPASAASVHVFIAGYKLVQGAGKDYTISGSTITMAVAPLTGEDITVDYRK